MRHPRNVDPLASVGGREMSAPRGVKPASQAVLIVLAAALLLSAQEQPPQQPPQQPALAAPDAAPAQQQPVGEAPTEGAPQQGAAQGAAPLRVMVGKSLLINTTERLRRIYVTDETVADANVITPTQILVHGRAPGEVSLLIWDEHERSRSFDLRVDVDVTAAAEEEKRVFPDEQITVSPSRSAIVLACSTKAG